MTKKSKLYKKQKNLIDALQSFDLDEIDELKKIVDYFYKKLNHKTIK